MTKDYPIIIGKNPRLSNQYIDILNPYNNKVIARQSLASAKDAIEVIENIQSAFIKGKKLSILQRKNIIKEIIRKLHDNSNKLAETISLESGKPITDSRIEVKRTINVFEHSLSISEHIKGEIIDLSSNPGSEGKKGYIHYSPIGPILAITPFNFPLNLIAHKVAPAIAIGCPIIQRPSSKTPLTAYHLAKIINDTDLPDYFYNFMPSKTDLIDYYINSNKIKKISFTGSANTGWKLKNKAFKLPTTLELGGNASCIISKDSHLAKIIPKCIKGAYSYSGQVCISIQKIHIHEDIYDEFANRFINEAKNLNYGNPLDENTIIGPIIDGHSIKKIKDFIGDALEKGASLLLEPSYIDNIITPFILENTKDSMLIETEELFGPGVIFHKFQNIQEVIDSINSSKYGLQAGIFSNNILEVNYLFDNIDIGALIVNDIPTFRSDSMPYGGKKESGTGREGIMYAAREMLEPKLMVINSSI